MPKIRYEKVIKAKRNKVFDAAIDYESFGRMMPQYFPSIRIRSSRDNVTVVEERICISGKDLVMMTKHVVDYPNIHEVFVIGGDAKGSHIIERYEEDPEGTRMVIEADIKLGLAMRLVGFFAKNRIQNGFTVITDEFARLVEG